MMTRAVNRVNVAVIGTGFSGCGVAHYLSELAPNIKLTLFENMKTDVVFTSKLSSASAVAAGLMHPISPSGALLWKGIENYNHALELIHAAEKYSEKELYTRERRIIRPYLTDTHYKVFKNAAEKVPEVTYYLIMIVFFPV
jgi:glycine/D-amino acid oxidase-like deaminating enzyme